jgi:hypothetical protein
MRESKVITYVWFEPSQGFDVRGSLTISDPTKLRLVEETHRLELKLDGTTFRYPIDADLSIRSRTYEPNALRAIEMIELFARLPVDEDGVAVTSVGLRLYDGTDEWWWDGGAWDSAPVAGEWNTEAEINANLATYDASSRKFGVVFNLATTDDRFTPSVECIAVLWRGPIDWTDDLLIDSLVGAMQDELTYIEDLALPPLEVQSASIDLDAYTDEQVRVYADADAVFDDVNDPGHVTDLLSGYDAGTRVLTLSAPIPVGGVPYLRMYVRPVVAWDTNQDFSELGALPQLILRDAENVRSTRYPDRSASTIVNRVTNEGVKIPAPYRATYEITLEVNVDRTRTQARLIDDLIVFFTTGPASEVGPFLRSVATDRRYRLRLIDEFRAVDPRLNLADVRTFNAEFRIEDAALGLFPAQNVFGISRFNMGFALVPSDMEAEAVAANAPVPTAPPETIEVT